MHMKARRAGVLAITALALLPLGSAPLGSAQAAQRASSAVLLRYHFVAGQSYAYKVVGSMHVGADTGGGLLGQLGLSLAGGARTITISGTVTFKVLKVSSSGSALLQVAASHVTRSVTKQGATTTSQPTPGAPYTTTVAADGSTTSVPQVDLGAYGLEAIGAFPAGPVAPGATWTTSTTANMPSELGGGSAIQVPISNVFSGYVQADKQKAAAIDTTGQVSYSFDAISPTDGTTQHIALNGTLTGHAVFGLSAHRIITSQTVVDVQVGKHKKKLGALFQLPHVIFTVTMQPSGW